MNEERTRSRTSTIALCLAALPLAYVGLWLGVGTLESLGVVEYAQVEWMIPFFMPLRNLADSWSWLGEILNRYADWLRSYR